MPDNKQAVILGARSIVGPYLLARLAAAGFTGACTTRQEAPDEDLPTGFGWTRLDPAAPGDWQAPPGAVVFALFPLPHLAPLIPRLAPARQVVAIGTSGLYYKKASPDPEERAYMARLEATEAALRALGEDAGCAWTLLRPTLIYSPGHDVNVTAIARVIERVGFFPVAAPARGLRQPVHADDIAQAAVAAVDNPEARDRAFDTPGGETLGYREMVERVFQGLGRRPRVVALPGGLLSLAFRLARLVRGSAYSPALFARMNADLAFDAGPAREALGYAPRDFHPEFPDQQLARK